MVQGTDAAAKASVAIAVHSTAGTPYDGAVVGTTAVVFPVNAVNNIATTTFAVPSAVTRILITGLQRSKGYDVTIGTAGDNKTVTVKTGASLKSDDGGSSRGPVSRHRKARPRPAMSAGFKKVNPS